MVLNIDQSIDYCRVFIMCCKDISRIRRFKITYKGIKQLRTKITNLITGVTKRHFKGSSKKYVKKSDLLLLLVCLCT